MGHCLVSSEPIIVNDICNSLIMSFQDKVNPAKVGGMKSKVNEDIRSTKAYPIDIQENQQLYAGIAEYCNRMNDDHWNFKLEGMDKLQFLLYEQGDHYNWHLDLGNGKHATRKLSIVIPLSSQESYEGGELLIKIADKDIVVPLKQGHAILFPSYILHKVTPVTKGKRFMLVGWMKGKTPFR